MSDEAGRRGDANPDPRAWVDARIDTPGREGLTGTAGANLYAPLQDGEEVTIAPDGRPMEEQPAWRNDFPIDWPLHGAHQPGALRRPALDWSAELVAEAAQ